MKHKKLLYFKKPKEVIDFLLFMISTSYIAQSLRHRLRVLYQMNIVLKARTEFEDTARNAQNLCFDSKRRQDIFREMDFR